MPDEFPSNPDAKYENISEIKFLFRLSASYGQMSLVERLLIAEIEGRKLSAVELSD